MNPCMLSFYYYYKFYVHISIIIVLVKPCWAGNVYSAQFLTLKLNKLSQRSPSFQHGQTKGVAVYPHQVAAHRHGAWLDEVGAGRDNLGSIARICNGLGLFPLVPESPKGACSYPLKR